VNNVRTKLFELAIVSSSSIRRSASQVKGRCQKKMLVVVDVTSMRAF